MKIRLWYLYTSEAVLKNNSAATWVNYEMKGCFRVQELRYSGY